MPLTLLFLRDGSAAAGATGSEAGSTEEAPGLTVREGFRSARLYRLLLASFLGTFLSVAIALNLVPILRSTTLAPDTSAAIAGLMGLSIVGRFLCGWMLDRANAGWIAAVDAVLACVLPLILLLAPGNPVLTGLAVAVFAVMGGATLPSIAYLVSCHFGQRSFATFYGIINAIHSVGVGLGPLFASYVFDRTGSYHWILVASVPLFIGGALLFATLGRYPAWDSTQPARAGAR